MNYQTLVFAIYLFIFLGELTANEGIKEIISNYQTLVATAPKEKLGELNLKLAQVYYQDQNQEKAFKTFLKALEVSQVRHAQFTITKEEEQLYQKGLDIYFDLKGGTPHEIANKIIENYQDISIKNPSYYLIGYLVATSYANLGRFEEFFDLFYRSYVHFPHHFLAYKAKAILHIKLFEREYAGENKEKERQFILENLRHASEANSNDVSLYKLIVLFSGDQEKKEAVVYYLNKIIDQNMMTARGDIAFYVQQAVSINEIELAQKFIDKATEWYQYSRTIKSAQQYLKNKER